MGGVLRIPTGHSVSMHEDHTDKENKDSLSPQWVWQRCQGSQKGRSHGGKGRPWVIDGLCTLEPGIRSDGGERVCVLLSMICSGMESGTDVTEAAGMRGLVI